MASQQGEEERPLTPAEQREVEECNRIIELHNLIVSGRHPTIKLTPTQVKFSEDALGFKLIFLPPLSLPDMVDLLLGLSLSNFLPLLPFSSELLGSLDR